MSNDIVKLAVVIGVGALVGSQFLAAKAPEFALAAPRPLQSVARETMARNPPVPVHASNRTELSADALGHFMTPVEIDGRRAAMLVDTGASMVTLTYDDAAAMGLHPSPSDFTIVTQTANGTARAAPVRLRSVRLGQIELRDIDAMVATRGSLGQSLLGMSFLKKLAGFEIAQGKLVLRQ